MSHPLAYLRGLVAKRAGAVGWCRHAQAPCSAAAAARCTSTNARASAANPPSTHVTTLPHLPGLELSSGEQLPADLVVVAGGRHALLPQACAECGGLCSSRGSHKCPSTVRGAHLAPPSHSLRQHSSNVVLPHSPHPAVAGGGRAPGAAPPEGGRPADLRGPHVPHAAGLGREEGGRAARPADRLL